MKASSCQKPDRYIFGSIRMKDSVQIYLSFIYDVHITIHRGEKTEKRKKLNAKSIQEKICVLGWIVKIHSSLDYKSLQTEIESEIGSGRHPFKSNKVK